jgi:hypothetical protein
MGIQILLLGFVLLLVVYFLSTTNKTKTQAWKKILFTLFVMFMAAAVTMPETTNHIAHAVGVGRGADLLLYLLAVVFVFFAVGTYVKFQEQRNRINALARKLALYETEMRRVAQHDSPHPDRNRR